MSSNALQPLAEILTPESLPENLVLLQDADNFERIFILDQNILQTPFGTFFAASLMVEEELSFKVPVLPLSFVGSATALDGTVAVRALLEENWYIELDGLKLALRFDPVLLRPVDSTTPHAEIWAESGLLITKDGIDLTDPALRLSLPPSEITRTGIVVALEGVKFDVSEESTPPRIADLGYDETFQGVYAESASIRILPDLRFGTYSGLALEAKDLVIGPSGVTCSVRQDFFLDHNGLQVGTGSEAAGELLGPAWPLALGSVEADIRDNVPRLFSARGVLRIPFFDLLFDLEFGLQARPDGDGYQYTASVASSASGEISTRFGTLRYEEVALNGYFQDETVEIRGVLSHLEVELDPFALTVQAASLDLLHEPDRDEIRLRVDDVDCGPLGTVDTVYLILEERRTETGVTRDVRLEASLSWDDLKSRVTIPPHFPAPPDSGSVKALITWHDDETTGERRLALTLMAELEDVDQLWRFVPAETRPKVRRAHLSLEVLYNSIDDFVNATSSSTLSGTLDANLELRLPKDLSFPGHEVLTVQTGDEEGWIVGALRTGADAQGDAFLTFSVKDPLSVDVQLPGLSQPEAPIHLQLTGVEFDLQGNTDAEGRLKLSGEFELRPISPPATVPIGAHLQRLLAPIEPDLLSGTAALELMFKGDQARLDLSCDFADANVDIDVFDLVANLSRGFAPPAGVPEPAGEVDLDLDVGFSLRHLSLRLGSLDETDPSVATVELGTTVTLAGLTVEPSPPLRREAHRRRDGDEGADARADVSSDEGGHRGAAVRRGLERDA